MTQNLLRATDELVIDVAYSSRRNQLKVLTPRRCGDPGGQVVWRFQDLPSGYRPAIRFRSPEEPVVDLQRLRGTIRGTATGDATGDYPYEIALVPGIRRLGELTTRDVLCFGGDPPPDSKGGG